MKGKALLWGSAVVEGVDLVCCGRGLGEDVVVVVVVVPVAPEEEKKDPADVVADNDSWEPDEEGGCLAACEENLLDREPLMVLPMMALSRTTDNMLRRMKKMRRRRPQIVRSVLLHLDGRLRGGEGFNCLREDLTLLQFWSPIVE